LPRQPATLKTNQTLGNWYMFNQADRDVLLSNIKEAQALVERHSSIKNGMELYAIGKETHAILEVV
jgi:hypothetical protein